MASPEQVAELRRKIGDTTEPYTYSDATLGALIDEADGDTDKVAAGIWREKMVTYAEMVDISEAGSSRKNSSLFAHAKEMAEWYGTTPDEDVPLPGVGFTTTRRIVRP